MTGFEHQPVLLHEVVALARSVTSGPVQRLVDCTVGGGGHAFALLQAFPDAQLLGIDRDPDALAAARQRLHPFGLDDRVHLVHGRFSRIDAALTQMSWHTADVVLADFGVSSHQLDTAERGFSFRRAGPLDMRMDPSEEDTAADVLATMDERSLAHAIRELGEERYASRVARAIVSAKPTTTQALADVVRGVVPPSRDGIDSATRTFQAIRMLVNRELEEIQQWLALLPQVLRPGGVGMAISFHSLEDRAVKSAFREAARGCICPPRLPVCRCGREPLVQVLTSKPVCAGEEERHQNPRARSAKLRAVRRLPAVRRQGS